MLNNKEILSIIPARGGSKGLSGKNIYLLNKKPLIAYSIEAALKSKYIDTTIVSSNDDQILNIAKNFGAEIIKRPPELATDIANSESVIIDTVNQLKDSGRQFDILVLLQPTSPLRNEKHIDEALDLFFIKKATALFSVYESEHSLLKALKKKRDGFIEGIAGNQYLSMRRQDLPRTFIQNGAIYIVYLNDFLQTQCLLTDKTIPYVMTSKFSLDIDTLADIQQAEKLFF